MIVKLTTSPGPASPLTLPVTAIVWPLSAALSTSSSVMLFTTMPALATPSNVCVDVVVPTNGLPAASSPVTVASKLVCAARSAPATSMLKV